MNTYKFKEPFDVVELENHADARGNLFEVLRFADQGIPGDGSIFFSTLNQGHRRGDHYHEKKRTWFTCVAGEVTVLLEDINNKEPKRKLVLSAERPALVYCGPLVARALYNERPQPATVLFYASPQNDSLHPDVHQKIVTYEAD